MQILLTFYNYFLMWRKGLVSTEVTNIRLQESEYELQVTTFYLQSTLCLPGK